MCPELFVLTLLKIWSISSSEICIFVNFWNDYFISYLHKWPSELVSNYLKSAANSAFSYEVVSYEPIKFKVAALIVDCLWKYVNRFRTCLQASSFTGFWILLIKKGWCNAYLAEGRAVWSTVNNIYTNSLASDEIDCQTSYSKDSLPSCINSKSSFSVVPLLPNGYCPQSKM